MPPAARIAIIGDFNPSFSPHTTSNEAIGHAAAQLDARIKYMWVPTPEIARRGPQAALRGFDAFWISPGSPYRNDDGAFAAIRFARAGGWPLFST